MEIKGKYDSIVNPVKGKHPPFVGEIAVMVSIERDLKTLCKNLDFVETDYKNIMMSRLYTDNVNANGASIIGPVVGASYATILLETMIVWGAKKIIFVGCCGAVSSNVNIGDIIIVKGSIIDEGVSAHYKMNKPEVMASYNSFNNDDICMSYPSAKLSDTLKNAFNRKRIFFREGVIWTTDALFRETPEKVVYYQTKHVSAVEMETSALFSVAAFRCAEIAAVLVVSDDLSDYTWRTGFNDKVFKKSCKDVCEVISGLCKTI